MPTFHTASMLKSLLQHTQAITTFSEKLLAYDNTILEFKPDPQSWNILECIAHLNFYGAFYNHQIQLKLSTSNPEKIEQFSTGWLGNYFANSMLPQPKTKKIKTFKIADFINKNIDKTAIQEFINHQKMLESLLIKAENYNLEKLKCSITLTRLVKLKLGDTLRFHVFHNMRHLQQMQQLLRLQHIDG